MRPHQPSLAGDDELLAIALVLEQTGEGKVAPATVPAACHARWRTAEAFVVGSKDCLRLSLRNDEDVVHDERRRGVVSSSVNITGEDLERLAALVSLLS